MSDDVAGIEAELRRKKRKPVEVLKDEDLLSSGSTMVNLAVTDKIGGAFYKGKFYLFAGESGAGKTWLTLAAFAEASINPAFDDYRFIHDNIEDGTNMSVPRFFGRKMADKIEPPAGTRAKPSYSTTVEELYYHLDDAFDKGRPFIYVIDSMDALESAADQAKFREHKAASQKKKRGESVADPSGSYGTAKAKANAAGMRMVFNKLKKSGSIVFVISHALSHIGFGFKTKSRSGGKALTFYNHAELWLSPLGKIRKTVQGKPRTLGIRIKANVEKNRHSGRPTDATVPIYWSHGIDDTGGMIDFLVEEGRWKKSKGVIRAAEFNTAGSREELAQYVESNDLIGELQGVVQRAWCEIADACRLPRKNKYAGGE